jgi:hypothetical protein
MMLVKVDGMMLLELAGLLDLDAAILKKASAP